ncbi:hypothetical protein K8R47_03715 [archaeon]|nr:hypothetical protein [archaeon]
MKNSGYKSVREVTPESMQCTICSCPAIYDVKKVSSMDGGCIVGGCPEIYDTEQDVYLIIGKKVNPKEAGLVKKLGDNEVLIEIPKGLLDKMGK